MNSKKNLGEAHFFTKVNEERRKKKEERSIIIPALTLSVINYLQNLPTFASIMGLIFCLGMWLTLNL